jgi:DeoR/GlpR family transcriptional regulator of sugar metabolism
MREVERRTRLVEHLRTDGRASVAQLATGLGVTPSTIRRDLQRLAREGRLVRTYGGAAMADRVAGRATDDPAADAKRRIAPRAS